MSSQDIKEVRVGPRDQAKRIMYLAKEFLLNNESVDIVSGTGGANTLTSAVEGLVRLKYVTYSDIRTETNIVDGRRRTRLVVTVKKSTQFQKLYEENEAKKKQYQEEKAKNTPQ
jgi:hypothetical protein